MKITFENIVSKTQGLINSIFATSHTQEFVKQKTTTQTASTVHFKVGDIFVESWGYEQTNVDFYQVVKVNKASVVLREIACESVKACSWASDEVRPLKDEFLSDQTFTKRVQVGSDYLKGIAHGCLSLHKEGQTHYRSWYA